jgi:predicted lipoprotein with Yx(FWY)xxD motif
MKNIFGLVVSAVAVVLLAVAAIASATPTAGSTTVSTARTGLGQVIADGTGRTAYLFGKDTHSRSACSGICATYWPPLLTNGKSIAVKGAKTSLLGSIRRADGSRQVTYAGHPLYFFSGDTGRGQTNGEGLQDFGASWYALAPTGKKIIHG